MNVRSFMLNALQRQLSTMFPGYFEGQKHNHYRDFGWPENITWALAYAMYRRNGIAAAGIKKTVGKTWETPPQLMEAEDPEESGVDTEIRKRFAKLRVWHHMAEADKRAMVGGYAGLILRFADNQTFDQPATAVPGGLDGLVEVIPAWSEQLLVSEWHTDQTDESYGTPKMFSFNEMQVGSLQSKNRQFNVHPDRVIVWSADGTVHCQSELEHGFNDLLTMEKISGSGGEGFWKNAKSAPVFEVDKEANLRDMAKAMNVEPEELFDKFDEQVKDFSTGLDYSLMIQGMQAKTLGVTLQSPEHFFAVALQGFAASLSIPVKILVGNQTGERASTEDADDWAQFNMSRRENLVIPLIDEFVERLVRVGILPERDWFKKWEDLTEPKMSERIERADKMGSINQKHQATGEQVFTHDEIREVVQLPPLEETDLDENDFDEPDDDLDEPAPEQG